MRAMVDQAPDGRSAFEARRVWLSRVLATARNFYPSPLPTYADELRALRLLKANLSPQQRRQFEADRSFLVIGGSTGRHYRITYGAQLNVLLLDAAGRWTNSLCFVPRDRLPIGDIMLAQKLALELFEIDALNVANRA
jgi:hypothetical protein